MMRKNRSMMRRSAPSPMVILAGGGLFMALVALVFWPKNSKPRADQQAPQLQRASVQPQAEDDRGAQKRSAPQEQASGSLRVFRTKIKGPLSRSFRQGGLPRKEATFLSALAARLLIWRLDLRRGLRRGDQIEVLYRPVETQSMFDIVAMRYKSLKHRRTYSFYRYHEAGKRFAAYYNQDGQEIEQKLENSPLREYEQVTSILKMRPRHKGVDFKTPVGTRVYLPYRARVVRTTWNFRYNGNCLEVAPLHRPNARILFLHLQKLMPGVKAGRVLPAGKVIALTGNTGRSTAPHLHYQIMTRRGRVIDPYRFHRTTTRSLDAGQRSAFLQHRKQLDQQLGNSMN